jgi:hypothetical protein
LLHGMQNPPVREAVAGRIIASQLLHLTRSIGMLELGERPGSGDGEREALLTRQVAFELLPAFVFALWLPVVCCGLFML